MVGKSVENSLLVVETILVDVSGVNVKPVVGKSVKPVVGKSVVGGAVEDVGSDWVVTILVVVSRVVEPSDTVVVSMIFVVVSMLVVVSIGMVIVVVSGVNV